LIRERLLLIASVEDAAFPITIDPLISSQNPSTAATAPESNQVQARFGWSVSGAGDVNGDGYSDIIAGAQYYSNPSSTQAQEGAFFVYHGNEGGGLRNNLQLFNNASTIPIQQSNITEVLFSAVLFAKNPEGRTAGKRVWETRAEGQAFSSGTGASVYSEIRSVQISAPAAGVRIFPNPAKDILFVSGDPVELKEMHLFNMAGKEGTDQVFMRLTADDQAELGIDELATGIYFLHGPGWIHKLQKK
jgi:hypothetical protein